MRDQSVNKGLTSKELETPELKARVEELKKLLIEKLSTDSSLRSSFEFLTPETPLIADHDVLRGRLIVYIMAVRDRDYPILVDIDPKFDDPEFISQQIRARPEDIRSMRVAAYRIYQEVVQKDPQAWNLFMRQQLDRQASELNELNKREKAIKFPTKDEKKIISKRGDVIEALKMLHEKYK